MNKKGERMDSKKLLILNNFINKSYECFSFSEFLKLAIMRLHELVMYDSGMFFCSISKDCSYFKPYIGGEIENYYKKHNFPDRESYLSQSENAGAGNEAYVYKAIDYKHAMIQIKEPRSNFLTSQEDYHIACVRIVYKGQFMGEIYLHRRKNKSDFDDEDLFILRLLQPHVSTVFNIIHTITSVRYIETNHEPGISLGMCVLDRDLSLVSANIVGVEMLKVITIFGSSVLYHVKELCEDVLDNRKTIKNNDALLKTILLKTANGDIKVYLFHHKDSKINNKIQYVIVMQYCDENQITADYKFKFTKREADIIDGLIQGKNNNQIAEALDLSENTIKTHIKSIYKKTGANNRTELTYVLMMNRDHN